jgi:hypothetical protein
MWNQIYRKRAFDIALRAALPVILMLGIGSPSLAGEEDWTFQFEPMYMNAYGHDQHVLTVHEIELGPPQRDAKKAVNLDVNSNIAYRIETQKNTREQWGWGIDFLIFYTSQDSGKRSTPVPSGTTVVFEVADLEFRSSDPTEVLYYKVLTDTDLEIWTLDFYKTLALSNKSESGIRLQFGLRLGDFDNNYNARLGIQNVGGVELSTASNYGLMMGPLIGLAGDVHLGRNFIEVYIGQSVLIGTAQLSSASREFTGPSSTPSIFAEEKFEKNHQNVAIPITEFRIKWTYKVRKNLAIGVGANTSTWQDVLVPPGVIPAKGGDGVFHENTIVFFGLLGSIEFTF